MNDKYLQYNLEDFLSDDSFIAFASNGNIDDVRHWESIISNYPDLIPIINKAKLIANSIKFKQDHPQKQQVDKLWANIQNEINNTEHKPTTKIYYRIAMVAAVAIAIFAVTVLFDINNKTIKTAKSEVTSIELPDQSIIDLNVDSKIIYNKKGWEKNRVVKLEGEAFFNVEKGEKFVVETPQSLVEVLGTSFNVYDRKNLLKVMCFTGKVRVINKIKNDTVLLLPGNGAIIKNTNKIETYIFNINEKRIWKEKVVTFDTKSLAFVFDELERIYNINIIAVDSILNRKFTGQIVLTSKEKTLEKICWPMHLTYKIEGKTVYITE